MARIAGVNIPTNKRVEIALTYIHGIGRTTAKKITQQLGIAAFAAQLALAGWSVRHYRYGPLEWAWRALTYTTTQIPFRRG